MNKITLKPKYNEIIYKDSEPNVNFDIYSYEGTNAQEKALGSLFLIMHIQYDKEEDLSYVLSLVSSLAKREYYSKSSVKKQDTKIAFENTLQKLNEVLSDLFNNKDFKLNIGLLVVNGEQIYISKLGKLKVGLARENEFIDVLNNISLFHKSEKAEQQFSNIISGTLQETDKIFAYFPSRTLTSREKKLQRLLTSNDSIDFVKEMEKISKTSNNFSCCAIYITFNQVKEIPVESKPMYKIMPNRAQSQNIANNIILTTNVNSDQENLQQSTNTVILRIPTHTSPEQNHVMSAELAVGKRKNILSKIVTTFSKLASIGKMDTNSKLRGFIAIALIVIVPLLLIVVIRGTRTPEEIRTALELTSAKFIEAQDFINSNNIKEGRSLLQASLSNIAMLDHKDIDTLRTSILSTLDSIDKVSTKEPKSIYEHPLSNTLGNVAVSEDNTIYVVNTDGVIYEIDNSQNKEIKAFNKSPKTLFATDIRVAYLTVDGMFAVYNISTGNDGVFELDKFESSLQIATLYDDNIYAIVNNSIYIYKNATTGNTTYKQWLDTPANNTLHSLTVDGSIYALSSDGVITKYFRGTQESTFIAPFVPSATTSIYTNSNIDKLYLLDTEKMRLFELNKADGQLINTYKINNIGEVSDMTIANDGTIYFVGDNKLWTL